MHNQVDEQRQAFEDVMQPVLTRRELRFFQPYFGGVGYYLDPIVDEMWRRFRRTNGSRVAFAPPMPLLERIA